MPKRKQSANDLSVVIELLQNLLAIELWRGGLLQTEIGKRLGISTGSANKMLKGVSQKVTTAV